MAKYRLKVFTGPVAAVEFGRRLRKAGLNVPTTGTEHVYVDVSAQDCAEAELEMRTKLHKKFKRDFGLRANTCMRRPGKSARTKRSRG